VKRDSHHHNLTRLPSQQVNQVKKHDNDSSASTTRRSIIVLALP
jgi:hypothetical protein